MIALFVCFCMDAKNTYKENVKTMRLNNIEMYNISVKYNRE